jgi:hypothetical protein
MLPSTSHSKNEDECRLTTHEEKVTETIKSPPGKVVDATNKHKPYREDKNDSDTESESETEKIKAAPKRVRSDEDDEPSSPRSKHPRLEHEITGSKGTMADKDAKIDADTTEKIPAKPKDDGSDSYKVSGSLSSSDSQQKIGSDEDNLDGKYADTEQTISMSEGIIDREVSDGNLKVSARAASRKRGTAAQKARTYSFPEKLMHLLDSEEGKESMCWLPDGRAFAISPRNFSQHVPPKYFEGTKFESFTRKLNRWGFKRVADEEAPGSFTYHHPLFRRGIPSLCRGMSGGKKTEIIPLSDAQVHMLQLMQGQNAPSDAALMAILMGGANLPDPGVPPMLGGASASSRMRPPPPAQLPHISSGISSAAVQGGGASTGLESMLLKQELLRQEAVRKNQEELMFQQMIGELIRRKAEEERLQQLLQAQQPSSSGMPPQMLAELIMRGGSDPSTRPSAMIQSQMRSPTLAPAATAASFLSSASLPPSAAGLAASGDSALMDEFTQFLRLKKQQEARQNWDYQQLLMHQEMMDRQLQAREQQYGRQDSDYQRLQLRAREEQQPRRQDPDFQSRVQEEMARQLRGREERDPRFG